MVLDRTGKARTVIPRPAHQPRDLQFLREACMTGLNRTGRRGLLDLAVLGITGVLVALGAAAATGKPNTSEEGVREVRVSATVMHSFLRSGEDRRDFGALRFIGGLALSSNDRAFGGYSGLEISADGTSLLAVSDAGTWFAGDLVSAGGRPAGIAKARIGPLIAMGGRTLGRARDRDAEALRLVAGDFEKGTALIGFERNDRIGFFSIDNRVLGAPVRYFRPPVDLPDNKGLEAVAVLRAKPLAGRVIAFAERSVDGQGHHRGWIWGKAGPEAIALADKGGFDITDMAAAPDGDLYVLERRFRWSEGVRMRVRRIGASDIRPGAVLTGKMLFEGDMRYQIDNMEGIALYRDARGRLILTLISDDNFNSFLQRTLVMQFRVLD